MNACTEQHTEKSSWVEISNISIFTFQSLGDRGWEKLPSGYVMIVPLRFCIIHLYL